jgi:3-hydroxyanthranilate 3,4-dioxygenase
MAAPAAPRQSAMPMPPNTPLPPTDFRATGIIQHPHQQVRASRLRVSYPTLRTAGLRKLWMNLLIKKQNFHFLPMDPINILGWAEANKACFEPPICNKLMYKNDLSIMLVGGPNTRTDFHLEEGSELFLQLRGNMSLPTIQAGERKLVHINEGSLFILPSRIPHSPQRQANSLGLVVERKRVEGESDALMWYIDFEDCREKLFERYFVCHDLGKDLVPVVNEYKASTEFSTRARTATSLCPDPPCKQDVVTIVPDPINIWQFIEARTAALEEGKVCLCRFSFLRGFRSSLPTAGCRFHEGDEPTRPRVPGIPWTPQSWHPLHVFLNCPSKKSI